jgi:hypothetical protein
MRRASKLRLLTLVNRSRLLPRRGMTSLRDEAFERSYASFALASPKQPGTMHIPGGEITQCAGPRVFVLDATGRPDAGASE